MYRGVISCNGSFSRSVILYKLVYIGSYNDIHEQQYIANLMMENLKIKKVLEGVK